MVATPFKKPGNYTYPALQLRMNTIATFFGRLGKCPFSRPSSNRIDCLFTIRRRQYRITSSVAVCLGLCYCLLWRRGHKVSFVVSFHSNLEVGKIANMIIWVNPISNFQLSGGNGSSVCRSRPFPHLQSDIDRGPASVSNNICCTYVFIAAVNHV